MEKLRLIKGGGGSAHEDPAMKALHALYMWKCQHQSRRVVIELNAIATEGLEPAVEVELIFGVDCSYTGYGPDLAAAAADAFSKDGSGA